MAKTKHNKRKERTPAQRAADALRTGRPPAENPRCRNFTIRVTADEHATLTREAQRRGMTITDMLLEPFRKGKGKGREKR
jgi:hypothetical protein